MLATQQGDVVVNFTPQQIAKKGEEIYAEKYRSKFEKKYLGKFVAIDVETGEAFLGDDPAEALTAAQKPNPTSSTHLIKIGSPGVYRVGYTSGTSRDWVFR